MLKYIEMCGGMLDIARHFFTEGFILAAGLPSIAVGFLRTDTMGICTMGFAAGAILRRAPALWQILAFNIFFVTEEPYLADGFLNTALGFLITEGFILAAGLPSIAVGFLRTDTMGICTMGFAAAAILRRAPALWQILAFSIFFVTEEQYLVDGFLKTALGFLTTDFPCLDDASFRMATLVRARTYFPTSSFKCA